MNESIKVGDRVRIEDVYFAVRRNYVGSTGVVTDLDESDGSYYVTPDGATEKISATRVSKVVPPSMSDGEGDTSLLPAANLAAATFAHRLLGNDADLDKLIGLAEFVMDRRTLGTETTGTVVVNDIQIDVKGPTKPTDPHDPDADRHMALGGFTRGGVDFEYDGIAGDVVQTNQGYLTQAGVDGLIKFLQSAKRHYERQHATA